MQFLDPSEKGMKAALSALAPLYGPSQRSGINWEGSGQLAEEAIGAESQHAIRVYGVVSIVRPPPPVCSDIRDDLR